MDMRTPGGEAVLRTRAAAKTFSGNGLGDEGGAATRPMPDPRQRNLHPA